MPEQILVVDDERDMRLLLRYQLEQEGYQIAEASDGKVALRVLQECSPGVIITDVRMPFMSGLELLREVKQASPNIEVIVATGYAEVETAIECLRAGAFDLVRKPFDIHEMYSCVARAVDRYRLNASADMVRMSQSFFATSEFSRIPQSIVEGSQNLMASDAALLAIPDMNGQLQLAHARGLSSEAEATLLRGLCEQVAQALAVDRTPALMGPGLLDRRLGNVVGLGKGSAIFYPLAVGDRLLGVLCLLRRDNQRIFGKRDLDRAAVLSSHVVLALENGRLACQLAASEQLATLGQVAAGIGHEINNPTAYIQSNLDFVDQQLRSLRDGKPVDLDEVALAVKDAREGAHRISDIVRDMRALARTDEDEAGGWFNLNDAIRSALRIARMETTQQASVHAELIDGLVVKGNPGPVSQVFVNLLVNAAQAIAEGAGERKEIRIIARRESDQAVIEVSDTGPGIPPERLHRLFQPFFTTKGTGTGLGLSISRNIVRRFGGDISVRSVPGDGTVFTVSLPAQAQTGS
ncbi:response regulator [Archangium sp.]|uniref:hybrid sensor histidine kinase/response regulator n=1 Tax=Archangium sp. TaxID=1872627 RepID=UPI00286BA071|nr:response regulator [Archangium sp.]